MASKYPLMNWESPNLADTLKLFKQKMTLVCEDNEVTDSTKIARKIKIGLGDEGLSRLNASGLSEDDKKRVLKCSGMFLRNNCTFPSTSESIVLR